VWTRDVKRAHRVAHKIVAGIVWINSHHKNDPSSPWGGMKESGMGRENGWECLREYTQTQSIVVSLADEPDWFATAGARYN
jgi:acyl-CoA reductase-like NAD-dependent aldehyde dehydrogenase